MSFFGALMGGAVLLASCYFESKSNMDCDIRDYNEMDKLGKAEELANGFRNSVQKKCNEVEKNFTKSVKGKTDEELLTLIENAERKGMQDDFRYDILIEEAEKRGL